MYGYGADRESAQYVLNMLKRIIISTDVSRPIW